MLQITAKFYYKLQQFYYKLRQCAITSYGSFIKSFKITAVFGVNTNYGNTLLQIAAGITNYDVVTNCVVTLKIWSNIDWLQESFQKCYGVGSRMRKPRELSKNFKHIKSSDLFMQSSCGQEITQKTTDRDITLCFR